MRALTVRLLVNVAAAVLIGLAFLDVAFVFWAQRQKNHTHRLELTAASLKAAQVLSNPVSRHASEAQLSQLARDYRVILVAFDHGGESLVMGQGESAFHLPVSVLDGAGAAASGAAVWGGYELVVTPVIAGSSWRSVVAARLQGDPAHAVLVTNRAVLIVLGGGGLIIVALALFFMRRTVIRPLTRITELAGRGDRDALSRMTDERSGAMAQLSGAIIAMSQQQSDDKARIADQLAALQRAHRELESAQRQLVRAGRLATVGQLAAGIAHEVGNPLAILAGYVELLKGGDLSNEERADTLGRMGRELDRIHITVRELLDFSRTPSVDAAFRADVREVLTHVRSLLKPQSRMRGVHLTVEPSVLPSIVVSIDPNALTQVLLNLLLNAADAVAGDGRIHVRVQFVEDDHRVQVDVEDSGPGIADDALEHIFEPFFTTKPPGQGTGLGLAVCERIIAAAGGDITAARSVELGGAAFTLTLPCAPPSG